MGLFSSPKNNSILWQTLATYRPSWPHSRGVAFLSFHISIAGEKNAEQDSARSCQRPTNLPFAIADFDGDLHPDMVAGIVYLGRGDRPFVRSAAAELMPHIVR